VQLCQLGNACHLRQLASKAIDLETKLGLQCLIDIFKLQWAIVIL
jgi:hypothetical protein